MLYEFLPSLYILAGMLTGFAFDSAIGKISAGMLIVVGVIVFNLRIRNRTL